MFITLEGLNFCWNSTQVELLKNYLKNTPIYGQTVSFKVIRELGATNISEKIRFILKDNKNSKMIPET